MTQNTRIIAISSLSTTHQIGLSAMKSVLGNNIQLIPTILISGVASSEEKIKIELNIYDSLESTIKYCIQNSIRIVLATGFFSNIQQIKDVLNLYEKYRSYISNVYVDPICGDNDKAYNTEEVIAGLKDLIRIANYTTPNRTELALLTGCEDTFEAIDIWERITNSHLILTSSIKDVQIGCLISVNGILHFEGHNIIPGNYIGTGDTFISLIIYFKELMGLSLLESVKKAIHLLHHLISKANLSNTNQLQIITQWEHFSTSSELQELEKTL